MPYFEIKEDEFKLPPAYFADIDGLVAVGGSMSTQNLLAAYNAGIYYWHHPLKRIQWWSPDPRTVLYPKSFEIEQLPPQAPVHKHELQFNKNFEGVLRLCQEHNNLKDGMSPQWLSERMFRIFMELHGMGYAQSVEAWEGDALKGGIFGLAIGNIFFGEYLVAANPDMAHELIRALLKRLREKKFQLVDMQKPTVFVPGIEYEEMARINYVNLCKENERNFARQEINTL
ncbi:leucyl/phenylalanyl-tRNA--protein transferase [Muriicola sp.]|uniref:leucyl/phenylalanyl-tRNA--protein transferase n=1 Tax=Muriicola sp. TaxID=2020856 RepID=UPI003C7951B7